jgi:hypothetical protein
VCMCQRHSPARAPKQPTPAEPAAKRRGSSSFATRSAAQGVPKNCSALPPAAADEV